jgi:hypothetical protein
MFVVVLQTYCLHGSAGSPQSDVCRHSTHVPALQTPPGPGSSQIVPFSLLLKPHSPETQVLFWQSGFGGAGQVSGDKHSTQSPASLQISPELAQSMHVAPSSPQAWLFGCGVTHCPWALQQPL